VPRRPLALLALALLPSNAGAQVKALKFRAVIDFPGHVIPHGIVLVDGDKISAVVTTNDRLPANAQVIDLTRYTGIPGLIDVHTHMTYYWDSTSGTDPWRQPQRTPAQTIELARANLRRTLETGVTTVRDLGSSNYMDIAMRDSIDKAGWVGPRMFPIAPTPTRRGRSEGASTPSPRSPKR
jgi:imidazolonepropionase-like amidohydrolase